MPTTQEQSIAIARKTSKFRKELTGLIGYIGRDDTEILKAYSQTAKAIDGKLDDIPYVTDTLDQFRWRILREITRLLELALEEGNEAAEAFFLLFGLGIPNRAELHEYYVSSVMSRTDSQIDTIRMLVLGGQADENLILGDKNHVGLFTPSFTTRPLDATGNDILSFALSFALTEYFAPRPEQLNEFGFQAVASIDKRTTETCLRVHGQVRNLDDYFILTGTPRFADKMKRSPFHNYCRTSIALVRLDDVDNIVTTKLLDASLEELARR